MFNDFDIARQINLFRYIRICMKIVVCTHLYSFCCIGNTSIYLVYFDRRFTHIPTYETYTHQRLTYDLTILWKLSEGLGLDCFWHAKMQCTILFLCVTGCSVFCTGQVQVLQSRTSISYTRKISTYNIILQTTITPVIHILIPTKGNLLPLVTLATLCTCFTSMESPTFNSIDKKTFNGIISQIWSRQHPSTRVFVYKLNII